MLEDVVRITAFGKELPCCLSTESMPAGGSRDRLRALPRDGLVVLGLPARRRSRCVSVVARELDAPLDIIVVRKLGVPLSAPARDGRDRRRWRSHPERPGRGADGCDSGPNRRGPNSGGGGARAPRRTVPRDSSTCAARRPGRVDRRRRHRNRLDGTRAAAGRTRPGCRASRRRDAVAPPDTVASLQDDADEVIALHTPQQFFAIGQFYEDFAQTPDDEVVRLLAASREPVTVIGRRGRRRR